MPVRWLQQYSAGSIPTYSFCPNVHLFVGFQLDTLGLCRLALDVAFTSVAFAAETVDGVDLLSL
jgi:hypothetical protein